MKTKIISLFIILSILLAASALGEGYRIDKKNQANFGHLLIDLLHAYETPSMGDDLTISAALEAIRGVNAGDYEVAKAIAEHWDRVYVNADSYPLYLYQGGERATELEQSDIEDSPTHAFVVLGFQLKNGEMTDELIGRCDAAAAAARSYPSAILVCSGGATGKNNPKKHTEAGLMRDYLVQAQGIDSARIFTDEKADNTIQNAVNTFKILREKDVRTITIITSAYHQLRGQVLYNAMSALYRQDSGFWVDIVANYSYNIQDGGGKQPEDRLAVRQLTTMLGLPDDIVEAMKKWF